MTNLGNNDTIINEFNDDSYVSVNELSSLKYIGVSILCDNNHELVRPVIALCDSGAEMCVIRSAIVEDFLPNVVGQVQLTPFCGDPIEAETYENAYFLYILLAQRQY